MDDHDVELAMHYQLEVINSLNRAKEAILKLSRLRAASGEAEIPKARMKQFARAVETAGAVAKDYRV